MLRMVEIFSCIAREAANPLSMVQKVASPSHIRKLLSLLLLASPKVKIIVLKILENLV